MWRIKLERLGALPIILMALRGHAQTPSISMYDVDTGRSSIEIDVSRGGLFKAFGHDHRISAKKFSGRIRFDGGRLDNSSVNLSIEAGSLTVLDPNLSERERSEVQATMQGVEVLDVKAFPKITFESTHVSRVAGTGDKIEITLTGRLNLHGVEKEMTLPVHLRIEQGLLHAAGAVSIAQTEFKITPVSAGGGTVRVKDQVKVLFDLVGVKANP